MLNTLYVHKLGVGEKSTNVGISEFHVSANIMYYVMSDRLKNLNKWKPEVAM